jgi:hypothetical protein
VHRATPNSITADDAYERQWRRTKPPISLAKPIEDPVLVVVREKEKAGRSPLLYYFCRFHV